jgi:subtilisin family serine protease
VNLEQAIVVNRNGVKVMATKRKDRIDHGFTNETVKQPKGPEYVIVELQHDSRTAYTPAGFEGPVEVRKNVDGLNEILSSFKVKRLGSHFGMKDTQIRQRVTHAPTSLNKKVSAEFAHSGFLQVFPGRNKDAAELADRLNRSDGVWKAVVAPKPVPAAAASGSSTASRNFEPAQGYLDSTPNGIGAKDAWRKYDAKGKGVTICDIEGNWNFNHEDLPRFRQIGGDLINDIGWINHGTAVLGEMVSKPGAGGTVGISHAARAVVQSAEINGVFNTAGAIANATANLKKGDVILIELHAPGPNGKFVAMQYWDDVFSAIRAAVSKGICVVEAAGNGNEDFQLSIFDNTGLQKDAGAIVVGAGVPPTNHFDFFGDQQGFTKYGSIGKPRSRIWFSNYGKIVNVQAWGWHVTTTGYGDAQGGSSQDRWYTHRFSGTSSASPIVTGAVACIQGLAMNNNGVPLTPKKVRSILVKTGSRQRPGPGVPLSQHIGPQPNLPRALKSV